MWHYTNNVLV